MQWDGAKFRSKLEKLSDSQQSIQTVSHWVQHHKKSCKESAEVWARETLRAQPDRRLLYIYLANDIMQNSRRKGPEFVREYGAQLVQVIPEAYAGSSEANRAKMVRLLGIWEERQVLDPAAIVDLKQRMLHPVGSSPAGGAALPSSLPQVTVPPVTKSSTPSPRPAGSAGGSNRPSPRPGTTAPRHTHHTPPLPHTIRVSAEAQTVSMSRGGGQKSGDSPGGARSCFGASGWAKT